MKGFIAYSSQTGNTKRMAAYLHKHLGEAFSLDLFDLKDNPDLSRYDYGLIGGYCDRAMPDKRAKKAFEKGSPKTVGLFLTMGAMPDSPHGERVMANLENLLVDRESLGAYLCPGSVPEKFKERISLIPSLVVSKEIKEQMIEAAANSREATIDELDAAVAFYRKQLTRFVKGA